MEKYNNCIQEMKNDLGRQVLVKIMECILQSRIDVKKQQIRTFDKVNKQINKHHQNAYESKLDLFLDNLLISEHYGIRKRIKENINVFCARIIFKLVKKRKGASILAEIWQIDFQQFSEIDPHQHKEEFLMISTTIEELLLFLNRQPLFSEYQKNSLLKTNYFLDYEIELKKNKNPSYDDSILKLSNKYTKERTCKSLSICIESYFMPKFDKLYQSSSSKLLVEEKKDKKLIERKTVDCTDEIQIEEGQKKQQGNRKISLYEFYDKDLDFVFLASDDETFKKKEKLNMNTIEIEEEDSEEFEILMVTKEEQFILENKNLLMGLSGEQLSYFQL